MCPRQDSLNVLLPQGHVFLVWPDRQSHEPRFWSRSLPCAVLGCGCWPGSQQMGASALSQLITFWRGSPLPTPGSLSFPGCVTASRACVSSRELTPSHTEPIFAVENADCRRLFTLEELILTFTELRFPLLSPGSPPSLPESMSGKWGWQDFPWLTTPHLGRWPPSGLSEVQGRMQAEGLGSWILHLPQPSHPVLSPALTRRRNQNVGSTFRRQFGAQTQPQMHTKVLGKIAESCVM